MMKKEVTEKYAAFELTWSLRDAAADDGAKALALDYAIAAREEVYVSDRLWDYSRAKKRIPDPFGVYRFVYDGSLRLVFAQAPSPSNVMPSTVYKPLCSRVRAGETRQRTILLRLPVDEYSSLGRDIDSPTAVEEVSKVFLVMQYRLRSTMDKDPQPPPFEDADQVGYIVHDLAQLVSSMETEPISVKRRTGYIARFPLPGEPKPGPAPMPG
jgi:hypothetical protein